MDKRKEQLRIAQKKYREKVSKLEEVTRINMVVSSEAYQTLLSNAEDMNMSLKDCLAFIIDKFNQEDSMESLQKPIKDLQIEELSSDELLMIIKKQQFWIERYKKIIDTLSKV